MQQMNKICFSIALMSDNTGWKVSVYLKLTSNHLRTFILSSQQQILTVKQ